MENQSSPTSTDWSRTARNGLRATLRGTAWLLSAASVFMEISSKTLERLSQRYPAEPQKPNEQ